MQEIQWQYYPHVAELPIPRAFIESQAKRQKQPKTVDAYARNLEDLISAFAEFGVPDLIEAGPDDIETYIDWLHQYTPAKPRNKITSSPGEGLSPNTIQQRIVTARLFYDFCIYRGYRQNKMHPIPRGNPGYGDRPPQRGIVSHTKRLPWIPSDTEWEMLVTHIMHHESARNQVMILYRMESKAIAWYARQYLVEVVYLHTQDSRVEWDAFCSACIHDRYRSRKRCAQ